MRTMTEPATRSACVVAGAIPEQVRALAGDLPVELRANRLGTLITGRPDGLPIDCAAELPGPVYDVMYSARTGWFAVTIYRGLAQPSRWDNRPGTDAGYPRIDAVLGQATPRAILEALDVPAEAIGYAEN